MEYTKVWLNYRPIKDMQGKKYAVCTKESGPIIDSIYYELDTALCAMAGEKPAREISDGAVKIRLFTDMTMGKESYRIEKSDFTIDIASGGHEGLLYGTFELLRLAQTGKLEGNVRLEKKPSNPLRMANHWDNMEGTIERGYSGMSFFFENNEVVVNQRTRDYARMMASVGINASVINNVNVRTTAPWLLTERYRKPLIEMAKVFGAYGIKLFLSLNFASPVRVGGLDTADPCDEKVIAWWKETSKDIFENVPYFGGFLVKADSEGEFGPFAYGRTHADGANMLADAVRPYGGIIVWRCFVYNCQQDWRDNVTDRARQSYINFIELDGKFADNVILQIKNGPVDFQVREPVHPLFGGLKKTNMMLEVQVAQEYTGQQRHVCYLLPEFREILDFKTYNGEKYDTVKDLISGKNYGNKNCGIAAVVNTGNDANWTGHDLAAANLYGFGRIAFENTLTPEEIAEEWIAQTFGCDKQVMENIEKILMMSWPAYEKYNAPLGIGWMVNPSYHFGPNVDGYEYDRWGTYHRISHSAIGRDRSSRGTGYAQQYPEPLASMYNEIDTCPEELLLFFHRVRFDHVMKSGETLLQHIYNTHFEGVEDVEKMVSLWDVLEGKIEPEAFARVKERMAFQLEHSKEWRDRINTYMYRMTEIPDAKGRKIYE